MAKKFLVFFIIAAIIAAVNYKPILKNIYPVKYEKVVTNYSSEYNLDPNLVYALIRVESKYNPYAQSKKGAIGLMQITPSTGKYIAGLIKDRDFTAEQLYDPDINIKYGCYYMSKLLKDFGNNIDCMLAAYNGGEGNVRKWLKTDKNGKNELDISLIPFDETRDYVQRVNKNYNLYKKIYNNEK